MKRLATTLLVAGLFATPVFVLPPPAAAAISVGIAVNIAPPPLPVYAQPVIPGPGYIWTPGYWAWDPAAGYYWVPGAWVLPPQPGLLWTPGWWGWSNDAYRWNAGYWGVNVGFYGGVNYGFGYFGNGYSGGYWRNNQFYYNRSVNNVTNVTNIRNVYVNKTVINSASHVSYNGGRGGLTARPTAQQRSYANQRRIRPTATQTRQRDVAMRDPGQRFKSNQGRPAVFATQHAGNLSGPHAVRTPASAPGRMASAPKHTGTRAAAPARKMVEAPRNRAPSTQAPNRARTTAEAPRAQARPTANRSEPQAARNAPMRNRGMVEAPRPQSRPTMNRNEAPQAPRERPAQRAPAQATAPRPESGRRTPMSRPQQAPHNTQATSHPGQRAPTKRNEKRPPKSSGGGR